MKNMSKLKIMWLFIALVLVLVVISLIIVSLKKNEEPEANKSKVPSNYIAVFHGGVGEITYETYIYKDNNGHDNMGFSYINTTSTTKSWGSSEWNTRIDGRGSVTWTDDVFPVAKEHGAYSYVTIPNSDETYSIEEFTKMFLMD